MIDGERIIAEKNGNSRTMELLRDRSFNFGALIFMLILAIIETIMAYAQKPGAMIIGDQPGIWIDVCVTWGCLVLFFICMLNLKTATPSMLVFAELTWVSSFSAMVDGMSYIVDLQPGLEVVNFIYTSLSFLTGPALAYIFLHFVASEKGTVTRRLIYTIRISTIAFVVDILFVILGCAFGWIFTIEPGNVYTENNYALFVIYPLAQLFVCLLVILISKDFKGGDKFLMSVFAAAPIFDTLISDGTEIYFNIHHIVLMMIMMLMYGMLYTKRNEEMLRRDIERKEAEAREMQRSFNMLEGLASDYKNIYIVDVETGEYEFFGASEQFNEQINSKLINSGNFFEDATTNAINVVYEEDREKAAAFYSREAMVRNMEESGEASQDIRLIIDGEPAWYREKAVRLEDVNDHMMCVVGMMDISEERKQELERQKNMDIIEALSGDFDYVSMVTLGEDVSEDIITEYRTDVRLERAIPGWKEETRFGERLKVLRDRVVHKGDRDHFSQMARREVVLDKLKLYGAHFINFRAIMEDRELYYQLKFMPILNDEGEIEGFVAGVHNVDAETRQEMETREQIERIIKVQTDELKEKNSSLNKMNEGIVELLGNITEGRDDESGVHVQSVKKYSYLLARQVKQRLPEYGLREKDINLISYLSALHDVGKIAIPDRILQKPGKLTDEEFEIMKTHCEKGVGILQNMAGSWSTEYLEISMDICRYHHEKWDGKGYPEGLIGDQIPIAAQIVSVADCYDALTTKRVYKDAYEPEVAFDMIMNGECGVFSDKLLGCLAECRESFISCVKDSGRLDVNISIDAAEDDEKVQAFEGVKILLVEDDDLAREINTDILNEEGAIVTTAVDGLDAVEIFMESSEYDLILMDMVMPEMDGVEATRQIRRVEAERMVGQEESIPIIVLTAQRTDEKAKECISAGADGCLSKPLLVPELLRDMVIAVKKRSDFLEEKLRSTEIKANTDALTGVKNITAYTDKVSELAGRLAEENLEFGIVMCDINNLKNVNDTQGHDAGDIYIKNCCRIICKVFAHSPVYRIGGDEFVAILQGNDYDNAEALLADLKVRVVSAMNIAEIKDGKASLAAGIAKYDREKDKHVGDVIKRADMSMYSNKKQMK